MSKLYKSFLMVMLLFLIFAVSAEAEDETGQEPDRNILTDAPTDAFPKRELLFFEEIPIVISATKREQPITQSPS